ncbi:inverse autotransporter beta domain-containing protein [Stappia sp.]|uniref:inverse autotransporter beta domain-containing protein n=1 Tax=Stappia sp. TaxID=1870903 RepID=UPI003D14EC00
MTKTRNAFLCATALCATLAPAVPAAAENAPLWGPHIEIGGKVGTKTDVGETTLFVPLFQTFDRLIYTDIRGSFGASGSQELNAGLGIRQIIDNRWIVGAYGFLDYRRSQYNNHFTQVTLGAELMSERLSFRANAYLPVGKTKHQLASHDTASVGPASITVRGGEERAMRGLDMEAGVLTGLSLLGEDRDEFWLHGGGYAFWEDEADTVWGPRLRAEYRMNDVLFEGSRVSLLAEYQYDEPRGSQGFFGARLRLPLQRVFGGDDGGSRLTPLQQRMTETVTRDVDIVAQAGAYGAAVTGVDAATGNTLDDLAVIDPAAGNVEQAIATAAPGRQVFINGTGEEIVIGDTIALSANQRVAGAFDVRNPLTGRVTRVGDTRVRGTDATRDLFAMADDTALAGLTLSGGRNAVTSDGADRVTLTDLRISGVAGAGINFENGSNLSVARVALSDIAFGSADGFSNFDPTDTRAGVGIRLNRASDVTVETVTADRVGMGIFANVSQNISLTGFDISNTAKEGFVFHYVHGAVLDRVNVAQTTADGAAFIASGDIAYRNSVLTGLGALPNPGQRSGINISSFSGDGSIIVGAESNHGYDFENLAISNATNSGMMIMGIRNSSFRDIRISDVDLIGVQLMQMLNPSDNLTFEAVSVADAGRAGFWMMGDFENLNGNITVTGTPAPCGRSPYMPTSLTQSGGAALVVNGTEIAPADVMTACAQVNNF